MVFKKVLFRINPDMAQIDERQTRTRRAKKLTVHGGHMAFTHTSYKPVSISNWYHCYIFLLLTPKMQQNVFAICQKVKLD